MIFLRAPAGLRARRLFFALAAGLTGMAQAAPTELEKTASTLDGVIEALKKETVDFNVEAQELEQLVLHPAENRVHIYVSNNVSQLLLENVIVTVNEGKPVRHDYSDRTARALIISDGFQRLTTLDLPPGTHKVKAEFWGHFADADKDAKKVSAQFETSFEKAGQPLDLELRIARENRLARPRFALVSWTPKAAGEKDDEPVKKLRLRAERE